MFIGGEHSQSCSWFQQKSNCRGREWTIGKPLGQGGFGAIYLIKPGSHKKVDDGAEYVVKVGGQVDFSVPENRFADGNML